jgi:pimeloyl-ACP methyl ester carboxylesterase
MKSRSRNTRKFTLGAVITALLVLASCGSSSTTNTASDDLAATSIAPTFVAASFVWKACDNSASTTVVQCSTLKVPYDYDNPSAGTFTLYVKKRPATNPSLRIGSMMVNPGGPGFGGSSLADDADYYFSTDLTDHFDIIAWDPRGTGSTSPSVDCVDNYDQYFGLDSPPDTPDEKQALIDASQAFNDECMANSGEILPYISTQASATDMNSIRQALGEDKISYFGFSYGSELGATWATMFPQTVRAAVLDGAVDPNATSAEAGMSQAKGFEGQLTTFLAACSKNSACEFYNGGKSEAAFDLLLLELDSQPIVVSADRTPVTQGVAFTAVTQAMYSDYSWSQLEKALADAQKGDGAGLLKLYDDYYQRKDDGSYGNELEAFLAISCLDDPGATSIEEVDAAVPAFIAAAPRLGANFGYGYSCALWPVKPATKVDANGNGAGPIVVIGTTGDPATPLESTRKMAAALEQGVLLIVEANQHTGYGANECINTAVDSYFIKLTVPVSETTCKI